MSINNQKMTKKQNAVISNVVTGIIAGICLLSSSSVFAQTNTTFSFGAKLNLATWDGDNPGSGNNFEAKTNMLGLEAKVAHGSWFGGLTLLGAEFEFKDDAPARPTNPLPPSSNPVVINRGETDLVLGYRFWPKISLFLDIKNVTNKWDADNYKMEYIGLGIGISGFHPVSAKGTLYGNFGFVPMNIKADGKEVGEAKRSAFNFGYLYKASPRISLSVGLQSQNQTNDYDDGSKQTHGLGALMFGINGQL